MPKISCFMQNQCILGMPQGIPMLFFLNNGESHVVVISFTHIHSGWQQNLFFYNFSVAAKCSKCLK